VGALGAELPARGIARGVCYCCKTAAITAPDGALYLAWRHVYAGNQRDIAVSTSRDRGRSFSDPVRVSEDRWQLEGCPENGPSLAVGNQGRVFVLWPTLVKERGGETLRLFLSSTADGRRFAARAPLPTAGAAYHPQLIASPDGTLVAAWDEVVNGAPRRVRLARGRTDDHGQTQFEAIDLASDAEGSYPALAIIPNHIVIAWTARGAAPKALRVLRVPTGPDRRR
jgi:predicted neuraminidase